MIKDNDEAQRRKTKIQETKTNKEEKKDNDPQCERENKKIQ